MKVKDLMAQSEELSFEEREALIIYLQGQQKAAKPQKLHRISEFAGIAAHLADDEDPQAYLRRLRAEWDEDEA